VALAIAAGGPPAVAEAVTCFVIQPGDTAALLAWRLTGDTEHRNEPWFQIFDPETSRPVAKSEYRLILPGWQVCVDQGRLRPQWVPVPEGPPESARVEPPSFLAMLYRLTTPGVAAIGSAALVSLAAILAWHVAETYSRGRRTLVMLMTLYGQQFVREFERPLMRPGSDGRALEARLRVRPGARRLDILLAPSAGHTYPNLSDHRKNVEYDVGRVLRLLNDERFVGERLSRQGRWVIVRCRFRAQPT
jgi:hypothetical protein